MAVIYVPSATSNCNLTELAFLSRKYTKVFEIWTYTSKGGMNIRTKWEDNDFESGANENTYIII